MKKPKLSLTERNLILELARLDMDDDIKNEIRFILRLYHIGMSLENIASVSTLTLSEIEELIREIEEE